MLALLLAAVPALAGPGSGTATISPPASVPAGALGKWTIVYTAAETITDGTVRVAIPSGWSAPQTSSSTSAAFVSIATNQPTGSPSLTVGGQIVTIDVDTLTAGNTLTLVYGDDAGGASARAVAATSTGAHVFLLASDPAGASPVAIGTSPQLTVVAGPPSSLDPAPGDTTVTAGDFAAYRIIVRDVDGNQTPVPANRTVGLFASHGAYYAPANHSTPITSIVILSGQSSVRVDYRATLATSGTPHSLTMLTTSGSPVLGGVATVSVVPGPLSTTVSTVTATSPVTANGSSQSTVTVTSKDAFANPRAGDTVVLAVTGNANKADPGGPTGADGRAIGSVTNTTAQLVTVSATVNGQALTPTALITFQPGPVSGGASLIAATSPVTANGTSTSTITVTARDANNNPISGQSVTLSVIPSAGASLTQPGGVTNGSGQATGTLSSTTVGTRTVKAVIGATAVTDSALVTFTPGAAASFLWSVDGSSVAGIPESVTLTARDALGHVVANYTGTVNLSTTSGGAGDGVVEWSAPAAQGTLLNLSGDDATYTFAAGDNGVALLQVTDTRAESFQLNALAGAASGTSPAINVTSNVADKVELVAGAGQSATVNTPVAVLPKVRVRDAFDNPVAGATVTFRAVGGGGSVDVVAGGGVDSTGATISDGTVDCDVWRLGTIAGLNRLRALIASGSTPSVDFTATGTAGQGANLVITPGSKSVTVSSFEVVTATLTDSFGNVRSGERVDIFIKDTPDGSLVSNPADPNPTTTINATARWGNTDASGRITVRYQAPPGAALADVLDGFTANVAQSSVADVTYTTTASGATNLRITFVGPSTKPADQSVQFLVEAVDGTGNVDTGNAATVTLTPEGGSGLQFSLTDFGATVTQVTLASGARTVYTRGTLAGNWDVTTSGGGLGADTEPVIVTDTGVIDRYSVATVASVVAGATFNVSIEARDLHDNRVVGASGGVTLAAIDDINPGPAQSTLLVTGATLTAGQATIGESYTRAEAIRVKVSDAGSKEGTSGIVAVGAAAAKRVAKVSGDATGVAAGSTRVLTAQVLDAYDNPVAGEPVSFVVTLGNGSVLPASIASNGAGNAATTLTTGAVAGDNRVRATILDGVPPSDELVEFSVTTVAGGIAYFTVVPQKTLLLAGETVPLTITAYDAGNNVVSQDDATSIALSSTGSAQFGAATGVLTDGVFTTTVRDTVVQSVTVTAEKSGGGPPSGTSALITVTNAGTYRVVKVSGDGSVTAGTTRPLEVEVRDLYGNPVPGALVTFSVASAPDGTPFFTDADGDPNDGIVVTGGTGRGLVTYHTASTAGTNQVNAQILDGAPLARERVTFTVNTTSSGATKLKITFLSASTMPAWQTFSFKVEALDGSDNLDTGNTSLVTLTPEAGSSLVFSLTDFGAGTTTFNLTGGTRVLYGRGTTAGVWDISAAAAGLASDLDVVTITHTGVVASYAVVAADSALAGAAFIVSIEARDVYNNKVTSAGNAVTLTAVDDITTTPTGNPFSVTQATLVAGGVVVNESYTVAELMRVRARDAGSFEGYSNIVKIKPAAAYRVTNVGGDGSGIVAGATRLLTARVLDPYGNPVNGQLVSFNAIQGGGSPAPSSGMTNAAGDVTTTLTTGGVVGTNLVRATILDGTPPALETVNFTVTTVAGPVANYDVTTAKTSLIANEVTAVTIKARDANGNYRTQDNSTVVDVTHTGNATLGAISGTLVAGQFATTVRDTVAQTFTVSAQTQGGGPTGTSPVVTVTNGPAYRVVYVSGNSASVPVEFAQPLRAEVQDQWSNPVAGQTVTYLVQSSPVPSSFLRDSVGDSTDGIAASLANGRAVARLHTSTTAGLSTATATILDGTPAARERVTFNVTTVAGGIDHYDVHMNATSTTAGVSKNVTVTARDINNNIVDDDVTQVTLSGDPGIGLAFGTNPLTLSNGVAVTTVTATQVQSYQVRASTVGNPSVTGLGETVTVVPAAPAGSITATATRTTITANGTSTTTITSGVIRDTFANQVAAGLLVNVSATIGGVIVGGSPKTIAANGRIAFDLRSSTTQGVSTVTMTSATGTASGTIDITFAQPPALVCATPPTPPIVVPGSTVSFSVVVDNTTSPTSVDLTTATTFSFTDGTHTYSSTLAALQVVPAFGSVTLVFSPAAIHAAFVTAQYAPTATLIGTDANTAPVNVECTLPALSLLVTNIEITGIVPAASLVSRGQSTSIAVTVKNNGAQSTTIDDVDLTFIPAGLFTVDNAPELGLALGPGASGVFNVPVTVQAGATTGYYDIDAAATGTVGGQTVVDNAVAPHPRATIQVTAAANLAYEPGTMTPVVASRGKIYAFQATLRNSGGGLAFLDSTSTRLTFTDGVRTFSASPTQNYAIAGGGAMQTMTFRPRAVPGLFTPGSYPVTLDAYGTENGAPFNQTVAFTGSPVSVVTPALVASAPGDALEPDQVSKTATVAFSVQLVNSGGATVNLTSATTTIRFAASAYVAALNPSGSTSLPPGTTTLQFVGTPVSGSIASGQYLPQVQLNGFENGLSFSQVINLADNVIVQDAPNIAILSMIPSQPLFTQDQSKPIKVRMVVANNGGANVNFTAASMRFIHAGVDRTNQFVISTPTAFSGGTLLAGSDVDTVVFNVSDNTGNATTVGNMTIEGALEVEDVNTSQPLFADTDLGGKGNLQIQSPAAVTFNAVIPSQSKVTQGMTKTFQVRAAVRNTGGSDVALTLSGPTSRLVFSPGTGWVWAVQPALVGGGTVLSGGEVDTMVVDVTPSGSVTGPTMVDVVTAGVESNSARAVPGSSSGLGSVLVQSPGTIGVSSVTPSRTTITSGTSVPWSLVVTLTNTGQADVDLDLGAAVSVVFQNASTQPAFVVPGSLAGGGTLLSGGETDQLVIPLTTAGTYSSFGAKTITVDIDGTELNSGDARNGNNTGAVTVQQVPDVAYDSLLPGNVSQGTSVAFAVTVSNPVTPNGATLTLDRAQSRLRFGSNQFNVGLTQASPVDVAAGAQVTLLFTGAIVGAGIPLGAQADAVLELHWTHNGAAGTRTIPIPTAITVENAPSLSIVSVRSSRATVTQQQSVPWRVTMVVSNTGGAAVDLDLDPAATKLGLNVLGTGAPVTPEYTIVPPTALESAGGTVLAGSATDSLIFDMQQAGNTVGTIVVNGVVRGTDLNSSDILTDDTSDGGASSFALQLPAALSVLSITTAQTTATVGQTAKSYAVKMAVRNTGGASVDVSLNYANSFLEFPPTTTGWAVNPATMPSGVALTGGETDTLRFLVTTTGGPAGVATIDGTVTGTETNTGTIVSDNTASGGAGSITLQTPAVIVVDSVTPSQSTVTEGTAFGWDATIAVHNSGQSDARLTLASGFTISIQDAIGGSTVFVNPTDLEEGGLVLAGGAAGTLIAHATNTGTFSSYGSKAVNVSVGAVETNSTRAFVAPGAGSILVQAVPNLTVSEVRPSLVTSGSAVDFEVDVANVNANAATAVLDHGLTRVHFATGTFSAYLNIGSPDSIRGGETTTLLFEAKVVLSSIALGPHAFNVDFGYNANEIDMTEAEVVPNGVTVQAAPQLSIQQIVVSQPTVTAGQTAAWTATMTVVNTGAAQIDLDLSSLKTFLTFIAPDAQPDNTYTVSPPMMGGGADDILNSLETSTIEFIVTQTGTRTGNIVISGRVEGRDLNQLTIVSDNTFDGGRGSIAVQSPPAVAVVATHTSQPEVTAGQVSDWAVRVVLANTGGADVDLDLAAADIAFAGPQAGWVHGTATLLGGGTVLEGGSVDSLVFTVDTTGTTAGTRRIDATVPWTEANSQAPGSSTTVSAGYGQIVVETPAVLRITTTTIAAPNPAEVNMGQAFDVLVQVQNTGQADARDVVIGMTTNGASTIQPVPPITEVAAGQTVAFPRPVTASSAPAALDTFLTSITSAVDENSAQSTLVIRNSPLDSTATVAIQTPADLNITNVRPSQAFVTQGQSNPWNVIVALQNTGEADVNLTPPVAGDVAFAIAGATKIDYVVQPPTAFGSGTAGWRLAGGAVDSLVYSVIVTGSDTGQVDIALGARGNDRNDPTIALSDAGTTTVRVQEVAGLAILLTEGVGTFNHSPANRDTVNTSFAYEIHVTVQNSGEDVDSVLVALAKDGASTIKPASLRRQSIGVDESHAFVFRVTAPAAPAVLETFTASILSGVVSHNSGQPVSPQPPVDNIHQVVTQRRADLVLSLTSSAVGGVVSPNQTFTVTGRVTNVGQASLAGAAEMTLVPAAGFQVLEPPAQQFSAGAAINWTVTAPALPQAAADFTCAITTMPDDVNLAAPAFSSKPNDLESITVTTGGALSAPSLSATSPAGAVDDTVSVGQSFSLRADVTATSTTDNITATLELPAGYVVSGGALVRNLGDGTGGVLSATYTVIAPGLPAGAADVIVTFAGTDENSQTPVPSAADTVAIVTVPRALLSVAASVTAPPEATDNAVGVGVPFTVTANVANAAGAAGIGGGGQLSIGLPPGYTLAGGESVAKPFVVGAPVAWVVNASLQPSGPDQIAVTISTVPADENNGSPAQVANGTANIAMVTEGAAVAVRNVSQSLGINTSVVPAGATDVRVLGFEIAYNASDPSVNDAQIDTIAITVIGKNGQPLSAASVSGTLARLEVDLGGAQPYVVNGPATNPIVVSFVGGGADRTIAPNASVNAVVALDLDAQPRETEIRVGVRTGGLVVRDPVSTLALGVTDAQGQPLDGQITSQSLVVLSGNFEEYAHNYPNPFRAGSQDTRIAYFLDAPAGVSLKIYAITGDLVYEETIPSGDARAQAGPQETTWDGRNGQGEVVRNGVYVCVLNAGSKSAKFRIAVAK